MKKIFLVILLFLFSCTQKYKNEEEPNDLLFNAQPFEIPVKIKGKLANINDIDFFRISKSNQNNLPIAIYINSSWTNLLKLTLIENNKEIKSFLCNENEVSIRNIFLNNSLYFIKIEKNRKIPDEVDYILKIEEEKDFQNFEREPNDNFAFANEIDTNLNYIKGYFTPSFNLLNSNENYLETDWFKCFLKKSNIVSVEITSVPGIDSVLEIYDEFLTFLKKCDSFGIDEPEFLRNYIIPESGYYFIKVYSKDYLNNSKIPYKLYITLSKTNSEFEIEPNDNFAVANKFLNYIKGYISPKGDRDFFLFEINDSPSLVDINITPLWGIDLILNIYNFYGELLKSINYYPSAYGEFYSNFYLEPGKYYVEVKSANEELQNSNDFYKLTISKKRYEQNLEIEPNDNFENANTIELNKSIKGKIGFRSDLDFYKLNISERSKVKISVTPVSSVNFLIEIYNSKKELNKQINKNGVSEGESDYLDLESGVYYIILRDAENLNSNYYENYVLSILKR